MGNSAAPTGRKYVKIKEPRRFICECGLTIQMKDASVAMEHAMGGHEVALERWAGGQWVLAGEWDGAKNLMAFIVQRIRDRGETVTDFAKRLNQRMDILEGITELQEAGEDRGKLIRPGEEGVLA